jgi:abortive infection bacteriophage resistance protein
MKSTKLHFNKPVLTLAQQVDFLRDRGLQMNDHAEVLHYLQMAGFYRLYGYARFYGERSEGGNHRFPAGFEFTQIINLYQFDRKLRLLTLSGIERIEVAVRTVISNILGEKYGAHWCLESKLFRHATFYADFLNQIEVATGFGKSDIKKPMYRHYYTKYDYPAYPPYWMLSEGLSFGVWSKLFFNLRERQDKKAIAHIFKIHHNILASWLKSVNDVRNICAHHERLWNAHFINSPAIPEDLPFLMRNNFLAMKLFSQQAAVIHFLLLTIDKSNMWSHALNHLFQEHRWVPLSVMGFTEGWYQNLFWQGKINPIVCTEP